MEFLGNISKCRLLSSYLSQKSSEIIAYTIGNTFVQKKNSFGSFMFPVTIL